MLGDDDQDNDENVKEVKIIKSKVGFTTNEVISDDNISKKKTLLEQEVGDV